MINRNNKSLYFAAATAGIFLLCSISFAAIKPMTLVSTGKPCFASTGNTASLTDRDLTTFWNAGINTWFAIKVGAPYSKLLLHWIPAELATWIPYWEMADSTGAPGDYQIQVSSNSTNGQDGTWNTVVNVQESHYVGRMHSFDFTGMQWVKMVITGQTWAKNPISLAEVEIFDVSNGIEDTWIFVGNSITSGAFHNQITPSFSQDISAAHQGYTPAMINGGSSGSRTSEGVSQINDKLDKNPDVKFWCIEYGTNDSRDGFDTAVFRENLDTIITRIMRAGHIPMIARIPWNAWLEPVIPKYNKVIDELTARYHLLSGPDLFAWFKAHPDELKTQDIHPNTADDISMNRLWAEAVSSLYGTSTEIARPLKSNQLSAPLPNQFIITNRNKLMIPGTFAGKIKSADILDITGRLLGKASIKNDGRIVFNNCKPGQQV